MSDLKRLIKTFDFNETNRIEITLSDPTKIRLNTEQAYGKAQLNGGWEDVDPFPLDTDLTVTTRITTPNGIKQWLFFETIREEPTDTTIRYRFNNGVRDLYFDGASWVTATATDWNTELEIQQNITSFPFDNNSIAVISNLITINDTVTPKLFEIKLLGLFEFEIVEDLLKTLMIKMHDEIRPVTDASASVLTTTDTFDLANDYKLQNEGYNIVDVLRVYNKSDDPYEKTNIVDSYTLGQPQIDVRKYQAGIVTTTVPIDAGKTVRMKIQYVPEVADYTDEDFYMSAKVPLIGLENIEEISRRDGLKTDFAGSGSTLDGIFIRDLTNLTAVQVLPPAQIDLRIGYAVLTDSSRDQKRLLEAVERFLQNNSQIFSFAFDEPYTLDVVQRFKYEAKGTSSNLRRATGTFDIRGVYLFEKEALDVPLVGNVNVETTT